MRHEVEQGLQLHWQYVHAALLGVGSVAIPDSWVSYGMKFILALPLMVFGFIVQTACARLLTRLERRKTPVPPRRHHRHTDDYRD